MTKYKKEKVNFITYLGRETSYPRSPYTNAIGHYPGKVYDLTQANFNKILEELERLDKEVKYLREILDKHKS